MTEPIVIGETAEKQKLSAAPPAPPSDPISVTQEAADNKLTATDQNTMAKFLAGLNFAAGFMAFVLVVFVLLFALAWHTYPDSKDVGTLLAETGPTSSQLAAARKACQDKPKEKRKRCLSAAKAKATASATGVSSSKLLKAKEDLESNWAERTKDLFSLLIVSLLVPLLATLIGYVFGRQQEGAGSSSGS